MAQINEHFLKLSAGYLFPEIARRVAKFCDANPQANVIKMGIGDVTEPLAPAVLEALHEAVDEMGNRETFRGYGPEQGYEFLREAIVTHCYRSRGVEMAADEIFVSDGSKCDSGNLLDIFGSNNTVAITDPVYPVYVDTNVMAGRTGPAGDNGQYEGLVYLPITEENNFTPELPDRPVDLIYLCYPNNPTGTVASHQTLSQWIEYAQQQQAIILYDAAYEAFITDDSIPRSIYEVPGARDVAIELRSFSKTAGFTGTRCAYTVVPQSLQGYAADGRPASIRDLWSRRQSTKFNGVSYPIQRAAAATFSEAGKQQTGELIRFYLNNAAHLRQGLEQVGLTVYGGVHAPYVWIKAPNQMTSWDFFDQLLQQAHVVGTPGSGFGAAGEGYLRLSAFNSFENTQWAVQRIQAMFA